ncbi:MAG: hypothetical protein ACOYY2_03075 [Actinomycetota bacterium]
MSLPASCAGCGAAFPLAEVLRPGTAGRCPSCGDDLAPGYGVVLTGAVSQALGAVDALRGALHQVDAVAPLLRVDVAAWAAALAAELPAARAAPAAGRGEAP